MLFGNYVCNPLIVMTILEFILTRTIVFPGFLLMEIPYESFLCRLLGVENPNVPQQKVFF